MPYSVIRKQSPDFRKNALELFLFLYLFTNLGILTATQANRKYTRHRRLVLFTFPLIHFMFLSLIPEMYETCAHTHTQRHNFSACSMIPDFLTLF